MTRLLGRIGVDPWKPGQSANPKGRPKGSRNRGLDRPNGVCARSCIADTEGARGHHPPPVMERLSNAQLDAIIARCIEGGLDPAATD